jgi:hypothetical protein
MALGLLSIPLHEFNKLELVHVYWKLNAWKVRELKSENDLRRLVFYNVAPHWSGNMPLKHLWQLWRIPELDGDFDDMKIFAKIRDQTPEEKEWLKKLRSGK